MKAIIEEYEPLLLNCCGSEEKIRILNQLSEDLERRKPLHSLALSRKAYEMASLLDGNEKGVVKSLLHIGRSLWLTGDLEQALEELIEGLKRVQKINENEYEVEFLNALGNVNIYLKIYDKALEYYGQALNLATAIKYDRLIAGLLNNIGEIHYRLQDYTISLKYYEESLKKFEKQNELMQMTVPLINLGAVYFALDNYVESQKYLEKSLLISNQEKDGLGQVGSLHFLGKLAYKKGNLEDAISCFEQCLEINREVGDVFLEVELYIDYFHVVKDLKQNDIGISYLRRGLELAEKIKAKDFVSQISSLLASIYESMGDVEETIFYYKKFHDQTKEVTNLEQESKLRGIAIQLKAEESQRKNKAFEILTEKLEQKTHELSRSYTQMKIISEIGRSITATLDVNKVFRRIYENINSLMDATVLGIGMYNKQRDAIEYKLYIEEGENAPNFDIPLSSKSSWAVWCFKNKQEIMVNDTEQEYPKYLEGLKSTFGTVRPSVIFCPLILEGEIIGVVTVQSKEKNAYDQHALESIRALVSYIVIAINNAEKSEKLAEEVAIRKRSELELVKLNNKLVKLSEQDGLTEIANRRRFDQLYIEEWERARRDQLPLSVILIDVDQFKEYNDHYGHQEGDRVLCRVAKTLKKVPKRKTDFVARYGGDEFVAVIPNTDIDGAIRVGSNMINNITSLQIGHEYSQVANHITLTVGAATITPQLGMDREELLRMADKALYRAKDKGRNRVEHFARK
ncbi:GGDEF domain-containing protein [Anaerobacillus sp. CMMVII]|uniref:GGDEF domain-containing protein n=1 Tax=Anaerobacillus sp. CMMVII TaxID=2755588 RepID=UPI0021B6E8D3|nr:GGDEF domain-containing protein [Anaerobacillus sp. CMMVII]MCT8136778.1 GGDEF domain-containing protein [Anaerobacillus sp. CMMVII]